MSTSDDLTLEAARVAASATHKDYDRIQPGRVTRERLEYCLRHRDHRQELANHYLKWAEECLRSMRAFQAEATTIEAKLAKRPKSVFHRMKARRGK